MRGVPKRKLTLYFPRPISEDLESQGVRLDRPIHWLLERAWQIARAEVRALPPRSSDDEEETQTDGLDPQVPAPRPPRR